MCLPSIEPPTTFEAITANGRGAPLETERLQHGCHGRLPLVVAALVLTLVATARAQDTTPAVAPHVAHGVRGGTVAAADPPRMPATQAEERGTASRVARFLLGAAAGLGAHEGGHLVFDGLFGVQPELKKVDFAGIPFFAITHPGGQPPRTEFVIASSGFWMQHLSSEIILVRHPGLRKEQAPFLKGWLAFNVLASVAYGGAAMAGAGPLERDTRAMADSLGVHEAWVGALVLAPAGLDAWRYVHPHSRWAKWASRGVKVAMVLLVARAG